MGKEAGHVLIIDDVAANRSLLRAILEQFDHRIDEAGDGPTGLQMLAQDDFDVVLLDVMMPGMDGTEVLQQMQADPRLADVPVLMVSASYEMEVVIRSIQLGAVDYIPKPVNPTLLRARVDSCVERRRLRRLERSYVDTVDTERRKSRDLLCNVLPVPIAERMLSGEKSIAEVFEEVTVLFADIVDFTPMAQVVPPSELVGFLKALFHDFDRLAAEAGLEKIKTIGDAYMAVAGLPVPMADHAGAAARLALALREEARKWRTPLDTPVRLRIGLHTGPVVAGVIGEARIAYDLWGDVVNTASRMESHGLPDAIQVGEALQQRLADRFVLHPRGELTIKGKGPMALYLLEGERPPPARSPDLRVRNAA